MQGVNLTQLQEGRSVYSKQVHVPVLGGGGVALRSTLCRLPFWCWKGQKAGNQTHIVPLTAGRQLLGSHAGELVRGVPVHSGAIHTLFVH